MLSREDNELLTRVGPGTPMGGLLRSYWMPALLSNEVKVDGDPLRLRLLGESLVAFRDSNGRVGILAENCPHRGASLFLGRNEEAGLACVYHGWKFDVTGACVAMPNEPPTSTFKDRIKHTAYETFERNGVVWIYMGAPGTAPGLPNLPWSLVPASHSLIDKRYQSCNFIQALEGGIDHTHTGFLHRTNQPLRRNKVSDPEKEARKWKSRLVTPRFETLDQDFGVTIAARRELEEESYAWHITHFLMPFYTILTGNSPAKGHAWVPMDDERTVTWTMTWHPDRPLEDDERANLQTGQWIHAGPGDLLPPTTAPEGRWRPVGQASNDWLIDREAARRERYMGVPGFWLQDQAVQESMGRIYDRTKEHLGTADTGIIRVRRYWKQSVKSSQAGATLPSLENPESYQVYGADVSLPRDVEWSVGAADLLRPQHAASARTDADVPAEVSAWS